MTFCKIIDWRLLYQNEKICSLAIFFCVYKTMKHTLFMQSQWFLEFNMIKFSPTRSAGKKCRGILINNYDTQLEFPAICKIALTDPNLLTIFSSGMSHRDFQQEAFKTLLRFPRHPVYYLLTQFTLLYHHISLTLLRGLKPSVIHIVYW